MHDQFTSFSYAGEHNHTYRVLHSGISAVSVNGNLLFTEESKTRQGTSSAKKLWFGSWRIEPRSFQPGSSPRWAPTEFKSKTRTRAYAEQIFAVWIETLNRNQIVCAKLNVTLTKRIVRANQRCEKIIRDINNTFFMCAKLFNIFQINFIISVSNIFK